MAKRDATGGVSEGSQTGRGGSGDHYFSPIKRLLGHGDLRFVILFFLKERPRHGYEIIKILEQHSAGQYTPSPGVIYPTLTFLEEAGYATSEIQENKKTFSITKTGREFLKNSESMVRDVLERMNHVGKELSRVKNWSENDGASRHRGERDPVQVAIRNFRTEMLTFLDAPDSTKEKLAKLIDRTVVQMKKLKESK